MGETLLVRALTPEMIAGGEALLRRVDEEGVPIVAAFWLFLEEAVQWKLIFVPPDDKIDSRLVYRKIRALLEEMGETRVTFLDISIRSPRHHEVEYYGYQVWRGPLSKTAVFHVDIGNRYLYRFLPRRLRG